MSLAGRALWRLISATLFLLWSVFLAFAAPALAQRSSAVERYAGEGRIGADPPFPVHLEVRTNGRSVDGVITSPGAAFKLVGTRGRNLVTGRFSGDGGSGTITLRLSEEGAEGEFLLGEQAGTLWARRTSESAASFFKGPEQKLELTKDQWREDLDKLVEILTSRHGSPFHRTSKQTFYHEVQRVRARIAELTNPQIAVQLARLAALIGDGHTWVASPRGRPRFSLETYWFEDGVRVVGIDPSRKELLGAALVAISDVPTSEVLRRLRAFAAQGETAWSYRSVAPYLLGNPDILEAAGIGSGMSRQFSFRTMDGPTRQITLEATSQRPERLALGGGPPLWERGTQAFRSERLADGSVYVNWRGYDNLADNSRALLEALDQQRPRRLILDLRDNGGGDYNQGRRFIDELKAREWLNRPDTLFVLTGRQTFSAAMTNAVDFKKMTAATLIGEPAGAAPNNWQEARRFHLPNSGLAVGVSTKYYEFLPGEQAVRPDLHIPPTPGDWGAPQDAAVRYILALPCPSNKAPGASQLDQHNLGFRSTADIVEEPGFASREAVEARSAPAEVVRLRRPASPVS